MHRFAPREAATSRSSTRGTSKLGARAAAWLSENLVDPASNLPRDDAELAGLVTELVILAAEEPASPEAMELNYILLEQRRLEEESPPPAKAGLRSAHQLSLERAALVERIAPPSGSRATGKFSRAFPG